MIVSTKEKKRGQIDRIKDLLGRYPVLVLADFGRMPAREFQRIRKELAPDTELLVTKKRLVPIAFEEQDKPGLDELIQRLPNQLIMIFTRRSPPNIYHYLVNNRARVFARPGDIAEKQITIPEGPTDLMPGPILTDLRALGVKTRIKGSRIWIQEEKVLLRPREMIEAQVAEVLQKLEIRPFEVWIEPTAGIDGDGLFYPPDVLSITPNEVSNWARQAFRRALSLAIDMGVMEPRTIRALVRRSAAIAMGLAGKVGWISPRTIGHMIQTAFSRAGALQRLAKQK